MKKLLSLLVLFVLAHTAKAGVEFSMPDIRLKAGETVQLAVNIDNDAQFKGFELRIYLPEGISFQGTSKGKMVKVTDRLSNDDGWNFSKPELQEDGSYKTLVANLDDEPFEVGEGVAFYLLLQVDANATLGDREMKLGTVRYSDAEGLHVIGDITSKITIYQELTVNASSADEAKGTVTGAGSYDSGAEATVTAIPTTGYEFVNWTSGEEEVSKANPYTFTVTEDVSLTANFQATTFTISYELDGGQLAEGDTNPGEYTIESEAIELKNPTKTGYTFAGWLKDGEETPSTKATIATGTTGNLKFTAQWTINQYTITFDTDGGSEVASITAAYESTLTKPADPTKEGYDFAGWDPEFPETMPLNGATLKATWTAKQYTITFDTDGGSEVASITAAYESTLTKPADPTKEGYDFAGWDPEFPETMPLNGATLKATWTAKQYTITFDTDGGSEVASITAAYGSTLTKPADPTKEGYDFAGWDPEFPETMPLNGATLKATWTAKQYTITFDTDGGSEVASITAAYGSTLTKPADPTKEGYDFAGWDSEFPETMPLNGATLKATWTPKQYTITFDTDGGSEVASITAAYGSTLTKPADPTKEGYDFAGWDPEFPETMPLNGATLKAKWTETSSIKALFRDSKAVNVYTVGGTLVGRDMTVGEVLQLKRGIYVINGKKIVVK